MTENVEDAARAGLYPLKKSLLQSLLFRCGLHVRLQGHLQERGINMNVYLLVSKRYPQAETITSVNKLLRLCLLTFSPGNPPNICCSDRSPEPPERLDCRNSVLKSTHALRSINGASGQKGQEKQIKVC